ncbi:ACT domain repeat 3 [Striga asiatica]|uniref:ACT domain repeat 3 n=1 Tax=Striga asiatica TaxID=4170 RepID=A0A5A7PWR4_STRAF|nr:ACT domain repeat 3 [Striga asiatica]
MIPILRDGVELVVRDGEGTRIADLNWVPGIKGRSPAIRIQVDGAAFRVKDLLGIGGYHWDVNLVKAMFQERDAEEVLKITTFNPKLPDKWKCTLDAKAKCI